MEYAVYLPYAVLAVGLTTTIWALWQLRKPAKKRPHLRALIAGPIILGLIYPSLVVTPPGHRGVVFSQAGGVLTTERGEGLSFVVPYFQSAVMMNVQIQKFSIEAFAQTSDLQEVTVPIDVNYRVDAVWAAELYRDIGKDYAAAVIDPAVQQLAKQEIGQIRAVDFAQARQQLAADIQSQLAERLDQEGIVVEFVAVSDAVFDPDFIAAVKEKIIADEEAEEQARLVAAAESRARQEIAKADGDRHAAITRAQGTAEANRLIDESLTENVLLWEALQAWSGVLPQTYIGADELGDLPAVLIQAR